MGEAQLVQFLAPLGVGGILAGVIFLFYRKDSKEWRDTSKGQAEILLQVVKENTAAITAMTDHVRHTWRPR